MVKSVLHIAAPRPHVFAILTDYPRYKEWVPGCERSDLIQKTASVAEAEIVISGMKRMTLGLRFETQAPQSIGFRMIRSAEVKTYTGSYRLMESADGKGTVVIAELQVEVGGMVPQFMVDKIVSKSFDDAGNALISHAQKTPPSSAPASAAPGASGATKPKRAKRLLRVVKMTGGYRISVLGESFLVKSDAQAVSR